MRASVVLMAAVLGVSSPLWAVAPGQTGELPTDSTWGGTGWNKASSYVYNWSGASAVAVAPNYLLSAAHVGGGVGSTMTIGATTYSAMQIYTPPVDAGQTVNSDLQLIRLDNALPGNATLYSGAFSTGQNTTLLGYGLRGTDHSSYYTLDVSASGLTWGTNQISTTAVRVNSTTTSGGPVVHSSVSFAMNFNSGATPYEAGFGGGDSGGGTFVKVGSQWQLAGINAYIADSPSGSGHYVTSYAISVPYYSAWINSVVPEPASMGLLLCGGVLMLARRRAA